MAAKPTIYIASRTESENHILAKKLEGLLADLGPVNLIGLNPLGLPGSVDITMSVVIFNFGEWSTKEAGSVINLREAGYRGPILVLAKGEPKGIQTALEILDPIVFLPKPFHVPDLHGIVRKLFQAHDVVQQVHRRYPTEQDAEIQLFERNDRFASRICNLSKGGAYLEFSRPVNLQIGQMLRVMVPMKQFNRTYTVAAKVVWATRSTPSGGPGIGVEFVGRGDVQRHTIRS